MPSAADEDWRLSVRFQNPGDAHRMFASLHTHAAAARAAQRLNEGLMAEHEGEWLRVYCASPEGLRRAQRIIAAVIEAEGVGAEEQAAHRRGERDWEPAPLPPVPQEDRALVHEHAGPQEWGADAEAGRAQVRFELADRRAALAFAERVSAMGLEPHRRGASVFVFAEDDAAAHELAERLRGAAPEDARVYFMDEGPEHTIFI